METVSVEFDAEVKQSWFTVRKSLRATRRPGQAWLRGRVSLTDDKIRISTDAETEEFRPTRLAWKAPNVFRLSGIGPGPRLRAIVLRFRTEELAKMVASTILGSGSVQAEILPSHLEEISAELTATLLIGPLFLAFILTFLPFFFLARLRVPELISWGYTALFIFLFPTILVKILDRQVKEGPVSAWFHARRVRVWLSIDDDLLLVRTTKVSAGYVPSEIAWQDQVSFTLKADGSRLHLSFLEVRDAAKMSELIKTSFPRLKEIAKS